MKRQHSALHLCFGGGLDLSFFLVGEGGGSVTSFNVVP